MSDLLTIGPAPSQKKKRVIGIDLGTTNSLVAYVKGGQPEVVADSEGNGLIPSVISFDETGWIVGEQAKRRLMTHPKQTVYSVKRLMGKGLEDVRQELRFFPVSLTEKQPGVIQVALGNQRLTPPELSALILKEAKSRAEKSLGTSVTQAVITVPAYFNDSQRQATKDAGRIAGLEVLRIVNEPTAACLAYGLQKKKEGVIAVYDLGGGTFDISILKVKAGIFEVLATHGNSQLGGDDLDQLLMELVLSEIQAKTGQDLKRNVGFIQELRMKVEAAKRELSSKESTEIKLSLGNDKLYHRKMTRNEFENLSMDLIDQTLEPCRKALEDANLSPKDVDEVVLVGGSTRMPLVRRKVEELFQRPPHLDINPDEVVALGAAIQADILAGGNQDILLLDVTPLSLGIETMGGVMNTLVKRNSTIPTSARELFTTFVDGQQTVDIHVLQGEREMVKDNRSLARFQLGGIDPLPAGLPRLEVKFTIDANGILQIEAKDLRKGKVQTIEVKPSYGLTDNEVEKMIEDSFRFAKSDNDARILVESQNEASTLLRHTERAIKQGENHMRPEERGRIEASMAELRKALEGTDLGLVKNRIESLNQATIPLAEALMGSTLESGLQDKKLNELP